VSEGRSQQSPKGGLVRGVEIIAERHGPVDLDGSRQQYVGFSLCADGFCSVW
jgi:hypothetical protein